MAYIEKEPIVEFITKGLNNPDNTKAFGYDAIEILAEIEYSPTIDVAPKGKVALDVIRKVKNKVRKYKHNVVNPYEHIILYLNELEKKYTEGE